MWDGHDFAMGHGSDDDFDLSSYDSDVIYFGGESDFGEYSGEEGEEQDSEEEEKRKQKTIHGNEARFYDTKEENKILPALLPHPMESDSLPPLSSSLSLSSPSLSPLLLARPIYHIKKRRIVRDENGEGEARKKIFYSLFFLLLFLDFSSSSVLTRALSLPS